MNAHPLDTYKLVKKLRGVGFSEEQAGAVTDALLETRQFDLSEIATKADIQTLASTTRADIQALASTTRADIQALKADIQALEAAAKADNRTLEATMSARIAESQRAMVQWAVGLFLAQLACVAGLLKFLH